MLHSTNITAVIISAILPAGESVMACLVAPTAQSVFDHVFLYAIQDVRRQKLQACQKRERGERPCRQQLGYLMRPGAYPVPGGVEEVWTLNSHSIRRTLDHQCLNIWLPVRLSSTPGRIRRFTVIDMR